MVLGRNKWLCWTFALAVVLLLTTAGRAEARNLEAELAAARSRAAAASVEVQYLRSATRPMASGLAKARHHAAPARKRTRSAAATVTSTKRQLSARRSHAAAAVAQIEKKRSDATNKHDDRVAFDIGLAIAALIAASVALTWSWVRASDPVAASTRIPVAKVTGAAIGLGLLALIIGAAMKGAGGPVASVGGLIAGLGIALPVAFLLARHSAEVQRGNSRAWFGRERMAPKVLQVIAGTLAALFLVALVAALTDGKGQSRSVTEALRHRATLASLETPKLKIEEQRVAVLRETLQPLEKAVEEKLSAFDMAQRGLHRAQARLGDAKGDERHWRKEVEAAVVREQRRVEREEREAARAREKEEREDAKALGREEREAEEAARRAQEAEACDPNYEGACLHDGIGDYDCAGGSGNGPNYVEGPIYVIGADVFGLDSDGNGIACEDG